VLSKKPVPRIKQFGEARVLGTKQNRVKPPKSEVVPEDPNPTGQGGGKKSDTGLPNMAPETKGPEGGKRVELPPIKPGS
jgi:hypothetical protein